MTDYKRSIPVDSGESGKFLRNCAVYDVMPYALDPTSAEKLWELSEKLVGQKFEI